jgi:glycine/D-amino acid oxidase-like deaminating enzyme
VKTNDPPPAAPNALHVTTAALEQLATALPQLGQAVALVELLKAATGVMPVERHHVEHGQAGREAGDVVVRFGSAEAARRFWAAASAAIPPRPALSVDDVLLLLRAAG